MIAVAAAAPYLRGGAFISDALIAVANNRALLQSREWLPWFARDFYWGSGLQDVTLYRPLTILSFLLDLKIAGPAAGYFVLVNALLHAGVSLLVVALGTRLVGRLPALLGGLLFAVHPLHAEDVAWVMGRSELLAALFSLAGCLACLRATGVREPRPWPFVLGAVAAYLAALFSKEHTAPLFLWFGLVLLLDRGNRSPKNAARVTAGSVLALLFFLLMRANALTRQSEVDLAPMAQLFNPASVVPAPFRWLTASAAVARYALLFLWPARLSHDYGYAQIEASRGLGPVEALGLLVILAIAGGIVLAARRAPGLALSLALAPITFVLVSNFPFAIGTIMAERLTYLPSAGLCLAAGWLIARLPLPEPVARWGDSRPLPPRGAASAVEWISRTGVPRADRRGPVVAALVAGVVVALFVRTAVRSGDWTDDYTLRAATLRASPRSLNARVALAKLEQSRGNLDRAQELVEPALRAFPDHLSGILVLAEIGVGRREYALAAAQFRRAAVLNPRSAEVRNNLAITLRRSGRAAEAEREFREAIRLSPSFYPARTALAALLLETGRAAEAFREFEAAGRLRPGDPVSRYGMAKAALSLGDREAARAHARQAADLGFRVPERFWQEVGPE